MTAGKLQTEEIKMIIDSNVYWFPEQIFQDEELMQKFLADVPKAYGTNGFVKTENGKKQIVIERPFGAPGVNYIEGEYTLDFILKALDEANVDKAVMKIPCCHEWMGLEMCRLFNDGMADFADRSGGRLIPLAVVPPLGGDAAMAEFDRCVKELGMKGIQLSAHYGNLYLDDESFAPLFEKLQAYKMTAYVHHTPVPVDYGSLTAYTNLRRSYGRCVDQMTAVCREALSGMFGKYPDVKVVHSMLGGGFFAYYNMLVPPKAKEADTTRRFADNGDVMRKYMADNIFFEMSHSQPWGQAQLECAVKVLGADHIVYGSSFPVRNVWLMEGPSCVRALDISEEEKEEILWKNATRLYQIDM